MKTSCMMKALELLTLLAGAGYMSDVSSKSRNLIAWLINSF
jgi:hypothetical protein